MKMLIYRKSDGVGPISVVHRMKKRGPETNPCGKTLADFD